VKAERGHRPVREHVQLRECPVPEDDHERDQEVAKAPGRIGMIHEEDQIVPCQRERLLYDSGAPAPYWTRASGSGWESARAKAICSGWPMARGPPRTKRSAPRTGTGCRSPCDRTEKTYQLRKLRSSSWTVGCGRVQWAPAACGVSVGVVGLTLTITAAQVPHVRSHITGRRATATWSRACRGACVNPPTRGIPTPLVMDVTRPRSW